MASKKPPDRIRVLLDKDAADLLAKLKTKFGLSTSDAMGMALRIAGEKLELAS